jgi:hypothetical protein
MVEPWQALVQEREELARLREEREREERLLFRDESLRRERERAARWVSVRASEAVTRISGLWGVCVGGGQWGWTFPWLRFLPEYW